MATFSLCEYFKSNSKAKYFKSTLLLSILTNVFTKTFYESPHSSLTFWSFLVSYMA